MAKQEITCDDILRELKAGQYRPIYYLMGEEPYYIDLISDYITDNVLNETEKEFNLTADGGDWKDKIPYPVFLVDASTLAQKQACFGLNGT